MKKIISILLVFAMLAGVASISVSAEGEDYSVYPESDHDYANDCWKTWKYIHPEETEGLFVTFSADTYFEPDFTDEETGLYKGGDYIHIETFIEEKRFYIGYFSGDTLASKTLYIPASSFIIELSTDESVTAYGFKIERIDTAMPENVNAVCYNFEPNKTGIEKYYECFNDGEPVVIAEDLPYSLYVEGSFRNGCEYRCGWTTEPGGKLVYDDKAKITSDKTVLDIYPCWTPLLISAEEVFDFNNSEFDFNFKPFDPQNPFPSVHYYMTPENHDMLLRNARRLGLPGWISYKEFKEYPQKLFQGACFGMASTAFLQYHGKIDLLSLQEGADSLSDLKTSEELISIIDYYQSLTIMSFLCQNKAYEVGSDEYKKQLKALFDTVSDGTPVLLSVLGKNFIFGNNHSMVVTGAYTDTRGNHYLLAYGGQSDYAEGEIEIHRISPDFSSMDNGRTFYWTDDYTHLEAFDMDGEGPIINWYLKFVPQMGILLKMLFRYLPVILGK